MATILVASRKGGSGKTTLAVHMAALADGPESSALLIDADPQGSAAFWYSRRKARRPLLASAAPAGVQVILKDAAASGVATVIIDSPPHDAGGIARLMRLVDFAVIPTRPGPLDLAAVASTIDIARGAQTPFVVILNAALPPRGELVPAIVGEAREVLADLGAPTLECYIAQRADLSHSLISGSAVHEFAPDSRAAEEISAAWREILTMVPKESRNG
jgi:chromosome partitioning protein